MCGIFGCILNEGLQAAPIVKNALKRLEYRGYDSAGVATIFQGKLFIKKDKGKIEEIDGKLNLDEIPGSIGIGHTRWATHGAPATINAHPITDCRNEIAVVHNGIIENFSELKKQLKERGHIFRSNTDTEVVPHLIEEWITKGANLTKAVQNTLEQLEGSFAIAVIYAKKPDMIVCARKESPLVIGVGDDSTYLASDIPAFLPFTRTAIFLEENEMAILKQKSFEIIDVLSGEIKDAEPTHVTWSAEMAEKGGFKHFMLKEIYEQPTSLRNVLRTQDLYYELMADTINKADQLFLVACGTSYHSCLTASYIFSVLAKTNVHPIIASEFKERVADTINKNTVVLAVSQSGETTDTLGAVRWALEKEATVLSVTNVMGSSLTRLSSVYVGQNSGPEIGVAATKTFTAQLMVLCKLAIVLGSKKGVLTSTEVRELLDDLKRVPSLVEETIKITEPIIKSLAWKLKDTHSFCFLGRGINSVTAMEGRLKLLELSYIPSLAYPAGESKHGFIAVVDKGYPVVFIAPRDSTYTKLIGNLMEMKARGALTIAIVEEGDTEVAELVDEVVKIPMGTVEMTTPMVYIIPLQLFALYMAEANNLDPDKPRNLAKSVTVE